MTRRERQSFSEWDLIALLTKGVPRVAPGLVCGIGDDCAVIAGDGVDDWLVTTDALIEDVHFRRATSDMRSIGAKTLAVNLSDIAAMGGKPRFSMMSLGLPRDIDRVQIEQFSSGVREVGESSGTILIGGDTCANPHGLIISMTVIGTIPRGKAILRSGAKAGDGIFVSGTFGSAVLGFVCLERSSSDSRAKPFIERHRLPTPRLALAQWLLQTECVTSMIDVSDGLVADLSHLAEASGVGFEIDAAKVPTDPDFEMLGTSLGVDTCELKLTGGEDYELLFTVASQRLENFQECCEKKWGLASIGTIVEDRRVRQVKDEKGVEVILSQLGFDHFSS